MQKSSCMPVCGLSQEPWYGLVFPLFRTVKSFLPLCPYQYPQSTAPYIMILQRLSCRVSYPNHASLTVTRRGSVWLWRPPRVLKVRIQIPARCMADRHPAAYKVAWLPGIILEKDPVHLDERLARMIPCKEEDILPKSHQ